jgi:hypothetical protein
MKLDFMSELLAAINDPIVVGEEDFHRDSPACMHFHRHYYDAYDYRCPITYYSVWNDLKSCREICAQAIEISGKQPTFYWRNKKIYYGFIEKEFYIACDDFNDEPKVLNLRETNSKKHELTKGQAGIFSKDFYLKHFSILNE